MEGTIIEALAVHAREGSRSRRDWENSRKFELRLHECDGLPDDDLPALERSRKDHAVRRSGILLMPRGEAPSWTRAMIATVRAKTFLMAMTEIACAALAPPVL